MTAKQPIALLWKQGRKDTSIEPLLPLVDWDALIQLPKKEKGYGIAYLYGISMDVMFLYHVTDSSLIGATVISWMTINYVYAGPQPRYREQWL